MIDRALPNLPGKVVRTGTSPAFGAPYDQSVIDREIATDASTESVWSNDFEFIAPAQ